jgi:hypothetical protein
MNDEQRAKTALRRAEREAQRKAELLEAIEREVAKAPPLSPEQRARLAVLLRPVKPRARPVSAS